MLSYSFQNTNSKGDKSGPKKGNDRNAQCDKNLCRNMVVCMEVSASYVLMPDMGVARVVI